MNLTKPHSIKDAEDSFERFLSSMFRRWRQSNDDVDMSTDWMPSADISESDQEYLIRADLPAVRKDDIKISIDRDQITISGERKQESETKNRKFHRIETSYGCFERSFALPHDVDQSAIKAESQDGVLTVHLPKSSQPTVKPIEISVH